MRFLFVLFFLSFHFISSVIAQSRIDVINYTFDIVLNDNNDSINMLGGFTFVAKDKIDSITIDLASIDRDGKGMKVINTFINQWHGKKDTLFQYTHFNNKLTIKCSPALSKGDRLSRCTL